MENIISEEGKLIPDVYDRIICVKVGKIQRENMYEMSRKYWKVNLERASRSTHVLAIVNGIVKAVFIPNRWFYTEDSSHLGRCEFEGKEDLGSKYLGKSVTSLYGKTANPVLYIYD